MSFHKPRAPIPSPVKPVAPKDIKVSEPKSDNALWRLPEWFKLPSHTLEQLKIYHAELLKFNVKLNLVSRQTERDADEVHFADCLHATDLILNPKVSGTDPIFDIGSGNGLPGVVMAIFAPTRKFFLVESDARKCEFIKHIVGVLKLQNVTVMNVRLETLKAEEIKVGVSRGFASISKTVLLLNKSFPLGGKFFHLKGTNWSSEIADIPSQLMSVWSPELVGEYSLPATQARRAVVSTTKISK